MADLHEQITARIDELERIAHDATRLDWSVWRSQTISVRATFGDLALEHVATWDPAAVLRGLAEDRDILTRHYVCADSLCGSKGSDCHTCRDEFHPCPEIRSLCRRHGLEVES